MKYLIGSTWSTPDESRQILAIVDKRDNLFVGEMTTAMEGDVFWTPVGERSEFCSSARAMREWLDGAVPTSNTNKGDSYAT